ncbi:MAG: hypothetical protein AAF684_11385, partial [Pseudomonadota bacterium]
DGAEAVVTIRATPNDGAALVIYGVRDGGVAELAATPPIGTGNRWLNPIGVGDLDGDATLEIAYVETPHIGGVVKAWSYTPDGLVLRASVRGYSNHAFGAAALGLGIVMDVDVDGRDEILLPDQDRTALAALGLDDDRLTERWRLPLGARIVADLRPVDFNRDARPEIVIGLADGRVGLLDFDR